MRRAVLAGLLLGGACEPVPAAPLFDEGDGEALPVDVLVEDWLRDPSSTGRPCAGAVCCRMAGVDVAYDQDELDALVEERLGGLRRAPEVEGWADSLAILVTNHACEGSERRYRHLDAHHEGPDLVWSLELYRGDVSLQGLGRSFLLGLVPRRRHREVVPDLTVSAPGGEPD